MVLRRTALKLARVVAVAGAALGCAVPPAVAQGLFSPVLIVNDGLITQFELNQRVTFLTLLGATGDVRELALTQLTDEILQLETATAAGFAPTQEAIEEGQSEFASRANLTREEFIAALGQAGVEEAAFRDFIAAALAWRSYIQGTFGAAARGAPDIVEDQAVADADLEAGRRVLLTEIILPASDPNSRAVSQARAQRFSRITSARDFTAAARMFSIAPSRVAGGELDWRLLTDVPPEVAAVVRPIRPGRASRPVNVESGIAVYFMRDDQATAPTTPQFASVDYLVLRLPQGDDAEATRIASLLDRCEDIHKFAGSYPPEALSRQTIFLSRLPPDLSRVIATLDGGETSTAYRPGGAPSVVMLCKRTYGETGEIDVTRLRLGILNARLQLFSVKRLNDIRDQAIIIRPQG